MNITYKIEIVNNYIVITSENDPDFLGVRAPRKDVVIRPTLEDVERFEFWGLETVGVKWDELNLNQILDSTGTQFTLSNWTTFYTTYTGNFNTAPGGSGAEYSETIVLSPTQTDNLGTSPVVVSDFFLNQLAPGQYYNVKEIIRKSVAGTLPYSSERLYFYGCFVSISPDNDMPTIDDTVSIIRTQSTFIFNDAGNLYLESPTTLVGQPLIVKTYSGNNPTGGNGIISITVRYTIETF